MNSLALLKLKIWLLNVDRRYLTKNRGNHISRIFANIFLCIVSLCSFIGVLYSSFLPLDALGDVNILLLETPSGGCFPDFLQYFDHLDMASKYKP